MIRSVQNSISLESMKEEFITYKKSIGLSDKSIENYIGAIDLFITQSSGDICKERVERLSISLQQQMRISSVNAFLGRIRVFLYWCMEQNYIPAFKIKLVKGQEEMVKFIPDEDLEKILIKPESNYFTIQRNYLIVLFLIGTGVRVSTLVDIKKDDIDFSLNQITLRTLKNKHISCIPLSSQLAKEIKKYLSVWQFDSEYLFPELTDIQMTTGSVRTAIGRYTKKKCGKSYLPHSFRHTFARQWILNGGDPFTLQHLMTHSDIVMTKKYVRLFDSDLNRHYGEYNPLDNLIKNRTRSLNIKKL